MPLRTFVGDLAIWHPRSTRLVRNPISNLNSLNSSAKPFKPPVEASHDAPPSGSRRPDRLRNDALSSGRLSTQECQKAALTGLCASVLGPVGLRPALRRHP